MKKRFAEYSFEKELSVSGHGEFCGYVSDSINLSKFISCREENKIEKKQNIDGDYYILDLDDVKEEINNRIKYWDKVMADNKMTLVKIKEMCELCEDLIEKLKMECGNNNILFYDACTYLKNIMYL